MFARKRRKNSEAGFTLVEIAIVLVIIGLLIGGVLKGQELIQNARVKRVMKQVDELRAAVTSYQDRYNFMPGDDNTANGRWGLPNGSGNGQIAGAEADRLFQHLAAAGFISGTYDGTAATRPRNPWGGQYLVQWATVNGQATHWFRTFTIPGDIGEIIDASFDDNSWNTGDIVGSADYATTALVTLNIEF